MKYLKFLLPVLLLGALAAYFLLGGLKNFAECRIAFKSVSNVRLQGIDLSNKQSYKNLKWADAATLLAAYANKQLVLDMDVDMTVKNPNDETAQLDGMDYILWIDDQEMLSGTVNEKIAIEGLQTATVSLPLSLNLYDAVKDKKLEPMAELALSLATDQAESSRVKVSLKPFFTIGGKTLKFPNYITIGGDQLMPKSGKR